MKKLLDKGTAIKYIAILVVLLVASMIPQYLNNYHLTVVNMALMYFIIASSVTLMLGIGGSLSMCNITFAGMGAFFAARLSTLWALPTFWAGVLAVIGTAIFAYILSFMMVRLTGFYFIFGTIGFCNMMATIYQNFKPLSNGPDGVSGIPDLVLFNYTFDSLQKWCVLLIFCAVGVMLIIERVRKSAMGRSLMSVRDNPVAAQTLGVDVLKTKRIAFTLGAAFAAFAGTLIAFHNGVVSSLLFTFNVEQNMLMMAVLGGINSSIGTLLGAFLIQLMPEVLRPIYEYLRLVQGIMIILFMIFMPMGLYGLAESGVKKLIKKIKQSKKGGA